MTDTEHGFDPVRLAAYLETQVDGFSGPLTAEKFAGGQSNPTFLLTAASGQYVLRRKPPGQLLKSAHAVDREYAVIQALKDTPVPVPQAYCLCEDDDVIGSMFYVMSYEPGRIFWDPALPDLQRDERTPVYNELIRILASLHNVDLAAVGMEDFGKPGNYFKRQLERWTKQYRASETETLAPMEQAISWLEANVPADDEQVSLIHGDFRLDNIIFNPAAPAAAAVLDWELSTLGHPISDLAYLCACMRIPAGAPITGLGNLDRRELGIPEEAEMISRYCELRGIDRIEHWSFYLAFSFFRLAAIAQGVLKRALKGNASNEKALQVGKMSPMLASMAVAVIEQDT